MKVYMYLLFHNFSNVHIEKASHCQLLEFCYTLLAYMTVLRQLSFTISYDKDLWEVD